MPTLTVAGHDVTVGDEFTKLSKEDQQAMVNHIAEHLPSEKPSAPSGVVAGFQHGIEGAVGGDKATLNLAGIPTTPEKAADNYKAYPLIREGGHWYNPTDWQPSAIPQNLAEMAPGMAQDMSAGWLAGKAGALKGPRAAAIAGMGGYAGSALLRTFGHGAQANADAETGAPNSPITGSHIAREVAKQAVELPLNMVGGGRLLPTSMLTGSALKKLGTTAATEAATGFGTDLADQVGTTAGSHDGLNVDGNRLATATATRAALGTAMAAPKAASELNSNRKYGGYESTPETQAAAEAVATRIKKIADGRALVGTLGGTKVAADAMNGAHGDIHSELADASKGLDLSRDNTNTLDRIKRGEAVAPSEVKALAAEADPDVMHLAHQALIAKQEIARGNLTADKFTGGIGGAMENLGPIKNPGKATLGTVAAMAAGHAGLGTLAGTVGAVAPLALVGLAGTYGLGRGIDRLTGSRSPAQAFIDRFGGAEGPTRLPGAQAPTPDPVTTSVPQRAPPQDTQLWGRPTQGIDASAQAADIKGMLTMAAARRKVAEQQQPAPAEGIDANALNTQVKSALLMAAARRNIAGRSQAEDAAAESHAITEQGGMSQLSNPAFAKRGSELLSAANVMRRLTAQPEPEAADVPAPVPEAPQPVISPIAKKMLLAQLKKGLPPTPEPQPAPAPVEATPSAPEAPSFNPTALAMLKQKLKAGLPPTPAAPPSPVPGAGPPASPAIGALMHTLRHEGMDGSAHDFGIHDGLGQRVGRAVVEPSADSKALKVLAIGGNDGASLNLGPTQTRGLLAQLQQHFPAAGSVSGYRFTGAHRGSSKDVTVALPNSEPLAAPTEAPAPGVTVVRDNLGRWAKITKAKGKALKQEAAPEVTQEHMDPDTGELFTHTPMTADKMWGRGLSHDDFAARETADKLGSGELKPENAANYHAGIVVDRVKREQELQAISRDHSASPDDTPLAKLLLQELHHTRRGSHAENAIKFYGMHMSPGMRAATSKLMSRHGAFSSMWDKYD